VLCREQVEGLLGSALEWLSAAPREAGERLASDARQLETVLSWSLASDERARRRVFELVETRRTVVESALRAARLAAADPDLAELARAAGAARERLNDLVAGVGRRAPDAAAFATELTDSSRDRDRAEGAIARALAQRGLPSGGVTCEALAAALPGDAAAVGFLRHQPWVQDETTRVMVSGPWRLLAHVLRHDGRFARVDLGPLDELEPLVLAWRDGIGRPLAARGAPVRPARALPEVDALDALGASLRERLLDPVLAAAGDDIAELYVCCDDLVHLVPLDALPLGEGVLGDRCGVRVETSFARLLSPVQASPGDGFLGLGDVDYEAPGEAPVESLTMSSAPLAAALRGAGERDFAPLGGTGREVRSIAELFEREHDQAPLLLSGAAATKAAFAEGVAGQRWVHLATHGWFTPEVVRSITDATAVEAGFARMGLEDRVRGFAPMTLCGLALAGANRGPDELGRVQGLLTAEELTGLDLGACQLAVLSACETNVGVRRAGQGIQSLQAALHAAGARGAITSLWRVDDEATTDLFEHFYRSLWAERLPVADALWRAKASMRDAGRPVRDWAAWVLSGDAR
jgi:CHAT domain-containing protein